MLYTTTTTSVRFHLTATETATTSTTATAMATVDGKQQTAMISTLTSTALHGNDFHWRQLKHGYS